MLHHMRKCSAKKISAALETVLLNGEALTPDLGGTATTTKFAAAIIREMER